MKYYKYINIDYDKTVNILKKYVEENRSMFTQFWTDLDTPELLSKYPEIQETFDPLNISVKKISIIITNSTSKLDGIHKDHVPHDVRINIPILNCKGSVTNFYKSNKEPTTCFLPNGLPYDKISFFDCELVDSFCLDKPAALRVRELHQVIANSNSLPRISATIEFAENIDYMLD